MSIKLNPDAEADLAKLMELTGREADDLVADSLRLERIAQEELADARRQVEESLKDIKEGRHRPASAVLADLRERLAPRRQP